ncbi:integral membrane protein [Macroventuria anomochaeta]|uniref:Integral membrane protein n=1 Tax=Macroventuria anomochaeta TaxID=301207 RepID=A0ACB6SIF1_9PLEO|nr:uncharacterized protein BU25DRAFT_380243 [Macroventuria anomochaeta]KAF2633143.1 integral membrane protein [Macroventuria anomochaeta]
MRLLVFTTAALLPLVAAHSNEKNDGPMDMNMEAPRPQMKDSGALRSYWSLSEHTALMYWHIGLEILTWVVILPVGVMLSIAHSRLALVSQFIFLVVNALALLLGFSYNHQTPELYKNNVHGKIGWIITCIAVAWVVMALIQVYTARTKTHSSEDLEDDQLNVANMARYQHVQSLRSSTHSRWLNDSGQGTDQDSASLYGHSRSPSMESSEEQFIGQDRRYTPDGTDNFDDNAENREFKGTALDNFLSRNVARFAVGKPLKVLRLLYVVIDRTILVQGFVAITSGTVVYGAIGHDGAIFNVLAHYIKGGIFFGYGLLTLGRWMGAFADFGWAWNVKPPMEVVGRRRAAIPSAEWTESFVIFLYGCINVFLEHLAAWGNAWTAQDLEHVSISIMFFGGGLLGMIIESSKMRDLINGSVASAQSSLEFHDKPWEPPRQYRFSMNPVPGLVILLLGKMMSSHHQASMLSEIIHSQWGSMFMGFSLARALTYITLYISPPTSYLPSRPPTEIITSFCLMAGGITLMASNKNTVTALESYDLDAMFTFTVTMGLVALIMAWTVVTVAIKGWAVRRVNTSQFAEANAGVLA